MEFISSDTNVWIDFFVIEELRLPFLLDYIFLMNEDAIGNELIEPRGLGEILLSYGLVSTELSTEEFYIAEEINQRYSKLSIYDSIALAIAKNREIILLSGDGPLRKAAQKEGVQVRGTLGILEELFDKHLISMDKYRDCLRKLKDNNGGKVRLPIRIIDDRLSALDSCRRRNDL